MTLRSIHHILQETDPAAIVSFDGSTHYTQANMLCTISALARHLQKQPALRWLLVHENTYQFAIGLFALLAARKEVLLPPNAQPGTLADLMQYADALLSNELLAENVLSGGDTHIQNKDYRLPQLDLDAPGITLFTSGSTGEPKAIQKSLRCLDAEIRALEFLWGDLIGEAAILATVSHQHIYGLLFRLLWPLCAGRPFAAHTHQYPEQLIADVLQHPRAALISSPSQLKRFPPAIDLAGVRPHLVAVFSSGGPLPLEAAQDWLARLGRAPVEILGSTETGGIAWRRQTGPDSAWQPLPDVQVTTDAEQRLVVQSPFTGMNSPCTTGDCAELQADGSFQLRGRSDRLVKVEEKRLSLDDMERHLLDSPLLEEVRVLVLPQAAGRLGVVATLTQGGQTILKGQGKQVLTQLLRNQLSAHFERVLLPRKWRFPAMLPTDMQGKTSQAALLALFASETYIQVMTDSDTERQLQITLPGDSSLFDGHFPGLPILPGVVQFDIAARQCAVWYPLNMFRRIDKLKFQEPVVPGDTITLTLQDLGNGQVQFNYTLGDRPLSSGRIVFAV